MASVQYSLDRVIIRKQESAAVVLPRSAVSQSDKMILMIFGTVKGLDAVLGLPKS